MLSTTITIAERSNAKMVRPDSHSSIDERHLSPVHDPTLELRRTLSRSPSKGSPFKTFTPQTSPLASSRDNTSDSRPLFTMSARKRKLARPPLRMVRPGLWPKPTRRVLQESSDHGNSGLQNMILPAVSPDDMQTTQDENLLAPHHAFGRKERNDYFDIPKSSPLKRCEPNFDANQASSPSAKRRSYHSAGPAFDFEHEFEDTSDLPTPTPESPSQLRKNSLRRTRLTTAYDTVPTTKSRPTVGNVFDVYEAMSKKRLSCDYPSPETNKNSPFSFVSADAGPPKELRTTEKLAATPRHPLSRAFSQASIGSDVGADSPTHPPVRSLLNFSRPFKDFTRSLPLGVARPENGDGSSNDPSNATPDYKLTKPVPAPFMSTGLISKQRNRVLTTLEMESHGNIGNMPDTPCKKSMAPPGVFPAQTPNINRFKPKAVRQQLQHTFGTPSSPFNPSPFNPQKPRPTSRSGIFGSDFNQGTSRRGSFADNVEDMPKSPLLAFQDRDSGRFETPLSPGGPVQQTSSKQDDVVIMDSKSILIPEQKVARVGELDESCLSSPSLKLRFRNLDAIPSFSGREARGKKHCPSPLSNLCDPSALNRTKNLSIASPVNKPTTPAASAAPPDPSNLSISGHEKNPFFRRSTRNDSLNRTQPATPTAARDSSGLFASFNASVTPSQRPRAFHIDSSITSRFHKAEPLNKGEFSEVFKVTKLVDQEVSAETRRASKGYSGPTVLYAVKRAKKSYRGPRDRAQRLEEVKILQALGQAEHTIQYFDHWEEQEHLYIQTEFCEEGSLQTFLDEVGKRGRLDDFRIWKILLEMTNGLKHIHDSGFVHFDIKPANVLITFEGILKIADFGMAAAWPVGKDVDGEGDRDYIGPEILKGKYDKPADIFALGIMMVEIATNVELPDFGENWQRLRSGDLSRFPSLTSSSNFSCISRSTSGNPIFSSSVSALHTSSSVATSDFDCNIKPPSPGPGNAVRTGELQIAPDFMVNPEHTSALDKIALWMISPEPSHRPVVNDLLAVEGIRWVAARRRGGAAIYEGDFGPADGVLNHDCEMTDAS